MQDTGGNVAVQTAPPNTIREAIAAKAVRPSSGDETRVRAFIDPPMRATPPPTDTESVWVDPAALGASKNIAIGSLLGHRYLLEYVLGEGGMGVVYRATDQEVKGETFAIKLLKPEIREHPESLKMLREEVRSTRALRHPNIVGVYSLNSDPGGIYMLMEYLEGKPLSALVDEEFGRGMPLMRAWPLIHDVGAALAYAHDHNVVHSDLKPSNVFVTMSGRAKLLDFGIARAVRCRPGRFDPSALGALTPAYASLEMLQGNAPDQSDDVYAFACVIYEMLSGKHPYNRMSAIDARSANLQPAPIVSLTSGQNKALARALAFERASRTASVEALLKGLEGGASKGGRRLPVKALAAGIAVFAAAGVVGWIVLRSPSPHNTPTPQVASNSTPPSAAIATERGNAIDQGAQALPSADKKQPGTPPVAAAPVAVAMPPAAAPPPSVVAPPAAVAPAVANNLPALAANASRSEKTAPPAVEPSAAKKPTIESASLKADQSSATGGGPVVANNLPAVAAPAAHSEKTVRPPIDPSTAGKASVATKKPPIESASLAADQIPATSGAPNEAIAREDGDAAPPKTITIAAATAPGNRATTAPDTGAATGAIASAIGASPATAVQPEPPGHAGDVNHPPIGKKLPSITSKTDLDALCPYPKEAADKVETGTVVLLVYVAADGAAANTQIDQSSDSAALDQATVKCVKEHGQFPIRSVGKQAVGYWARVKMGWGVMVN